MMKMEMGERIISFIRGVPHRQRYINNKANKTKKREDTHLRWVRGMGNNVSKHNTHSKWLGVLLLDI